MNKEFEQTAPESQYGRQVIDEYLKIRIIEWLSKEVRLLKTMNPNESLQMMG